jgi:predicted dehydrogenase
VIATPVSTHYDLAYRALYHKKHVLVEKPLCDSSEKVQHLINTAAEHDLILMVDHTFLFTGAVQKIKSLIDEDELGDIYYYDSVRVNLGLFQNDVDVMWDLAVHDLSIMDHLLSEKPTRVCATGIQHLEDQQTNMAYLTLDFDGKLLSHLHVNWLAPVKIRRTLIGGNKKMIVYDDLEPSEKVKVYDKGVDVISGEDQTSISKMLSYRRTGDMIVPKLAVTEALDVEARHFVHCVRGLEKPLTDGASGYRVVKILEAASQSLTNEGRWVDLDF